ncbi:MAG: hypothetical protein A2100_00065 [Sideroxydans sp. GWF2_59_14]|nr:MAG: hypothetical protein A2100_00065 [Sideroxydans sp. GWF2_59_14]HAF45144.1 hypothetical protein [Gallionellaceae bacterium]
MFEKIKGLGSQVANKANDAVEGVTTSVKGGVESLAQTASDMTDALNEKAVRASTAQMCSILEIALDELKTRPLSAQPVSLKATVNIGIAALEMEIRVPPGTKNELNDSGSD